MDSQQYSVNLYNGRSYCEAVQDAYNAHRRSNSLCRLFNEKCSLKCRSLMPNWSEFVEIWLQVRKPGRPHVLIKIREFKIEWFSRMESPTIEICSNHLPSSKYLLFGAIRSSSRDLYEVLYKRFFTRELYRVPQELWSQETLWCQEAVKMRRTIFLKRLLIGCIEMAFWYDFIWFRINFSILKWMLRREFNGC